MFQNYLNQGLILTLKYSKPQELKISQWNKKTFILQITWYPQKSHNTYKSNEEALNILNNLNLQMNKNEKALSIQDQQLLELVIKLEQEQSK